MQQTISLLSSQYRSLFTRGSFAHNVLVMFTGTAIGQFGVVLLAPILTRIYSPEMYGVLGMFTATVSILSVIAALRYEIALPLAQSEEEAANLFGVCLASLAATTLFGCLLVLLAAAFGAGADLLGALEPYGWLLPLGYFCIGAYHVMIYYATRKSAFHIIARTKIYQGVLGPMSQIGFGVSGFGTWGLITGFIIGQSTGISLLFSRLVLIPRALQHITIDGMKAMARRFWRFPLISSWAALLEAAGGTYLLLVAIPLLYSNVIGGFIFITDRVVGRPLYMISTSILQVYVGDMSRTIGTDPAAVRRRFLHLAGQQLIIVAAWLILVNVAAPYVFPVFFGPVWADAVPYLHVLSIAYLTQMVMHALIHTLQLIERQGLSAMWETGRLLAVASAFALSYLIGFDALHALLVYSIVQAVAQVVLFILMYRSIQLLQKVPLDAGV